MSGLLSIAVSGLNAANLGMATTSHNIANVNTPGYSRQTITQRAAIGNSSGGFGGQGVELSGVQRMVSDFTTQQTHIATSDAAKSTLQLGYLNRMADLLTNDATSLSSSINTFFSGLQDLAANPAGVTERQTVLAQATSLTNTFNNLDKQLSSTQGEIGSRLGTAAQKINSIATQIAKLNDQIAAAYGGGQQPNDLQDQRDALMRELSGQVRVSTVSQSDGRIDVFLPSGDALVLRSDTTQVTVQTDPADPSKFVFAAKGASTGGVARTIQPSVDLGGEVGGLIALQSTISDARNELGRLAVSTADAVNKQQGLGQDLNGAAGAAMFNIGSPRAYSFGTTTGALSVSYADPSALKASDYRLDYDGTNYKLTRKSDGNVTSYTTLPQTVDGIKIDASTPLAAGDTFMIQPVRQNASAVKVIMTDTSKIAAASPVSAQAASTNFGNASIGSIDVNGPTRDANLTAGVQLTFTSGSAYSYTRPAPAPTSGTGTIGSDGAITLNGWTMKLTGTPTAGDTFSVGSNLPGTGDNRNALALGKLAEKGIVDGATLASANSELVGDVGNQAASMNIASTANDRLLTQLQTDEQSISGVNLDEEASNLLRYQQAYQAAAKAISAAQTMFDTIISIAG
ncbi:flagellar hook-associated protein FlgK [soil metagenome]